jgi:transcriptional regulator with XRE-family HTH domain
VDAASRFQECLIVFRKRRNWTQEELGERTGLTRETVGAWEQGRAMGDAVNKLVAVADALGVSLDELCGRSVPRAPERAIAETVVSLLGDRLSDKIMETVGRAVTNALFRPAEWRRQPGRQSSPRPFEGRTSSANPAQRRRRARTS